MSAGAYVVALAYLTALVALAAAGAVVLRRFLLPGWGGATARLAEAVLAIAIVVLAAEALGSFGALTRAGLLAGVAVAALAARLLTPRTPRPPAAAPPPAPSVPAWQLTLTVAAAALVVLHWSGGVQDSLATGIYRQDSVWYHLPLSAGFFQSGDTWALHFTDPLALTAWLYPQTSELLHAVGMLGSGNDFLSPLLNLGWLTLALAAGWCVGRPYGLGPATAIATALLLDSGAMTTQAGNAPSDTPALFFLLASVALLVNADAAEDGLWGRRSSGALLLAALAAGLALGTKVSLLAPLLALSLGVAAIAPRRARGRVALVWLAGLSAGGGYWYLRNLVHTGNPLPWLQIGPLPSPQQPELYPRPPHSVADDLDDPGLWPAEFFPRLATTLGEAWPLVLLAAAAGLGIAMLRGRSPLLRMLGGVGVLAAVAYAFIPISASGVEGQPSGFETNLRYLAPALVLGLALLPLALPRPLARWAAPGLAAILALNASTAGDWDLAQVPTGLLLALALAAAPAGLLAMRRRSWGHTAAAGLLGLAAAGLVLLGYGAQRDYLRDRYVASLAPAADSPGFRATPEWRAIQEWARGLEGERIGVVGPPAAYGQYVFYDGELSNRVRYVGARGQNGAYLPIEDCAAWLRALDEGGYGYVVVTPAASIGPEPVPRESLWTSADPGAREIVRAGGASVFRIERPLDPGSCRRVAPQPIVRVPGGGFAVPGVTLPPPPGE